MDKERVILSLENRLYEAQDFDINNYFDYCALLYYLSSYYKNDEKKYNDYFYKGRKTFKNLLNEIVNKNCELRGVSTWNGIVGVLYLANAFNLNKDLNKVIDYLESYVEKETYALLNNNFSMNKNDYDLVGGLAGVGLYFLKQDFEKWNIIIDEITKRLLKVLSVYNEIHEELLTKKYATNKMCNEIDYSVSHGMLGVLYFLAKFYSVTNNKYVKKKIIKALTIYGYFLDDREHNIITKFPSIARINDDGEITFYYSNRSVWCYGSIGSYRALYLIADYIGNLELKNKIITQVADFNNYSLLDLNLKCPTFCHGLSGMYLILNYFSKECREIEINKVCSAIENEIWRFYDNNLPFLFPKYDDNGSGVQKQDLKNTSFVGGSVSVAIAYILSKTNIKNDFFSYSLALK